MKDLTGKVNYDGLEAADWNQLPSELQNFIISNGLTLTNTDLQQANQAIADYVGRADHYVGSGTGDVQILTPHDSLFAPPSYETGQHIRWSPSAANTITNPTVNVAELGAKVVVDESGGALQVGELSVNQERRAFYDGTSFRLHDITQGSGISPNVLLDEVVVSASVNTVDLVSVDWPATYNRLEIELNAVDLTQPGRSLAMLTIDNGTPVTIFTGISCQYHGSANAGVEIAQKNLGLQVIPPFLDLDSPYADSKIDVVAHPGTRLSVSGQSSFIDTGDIAVNNFSGALEATAGHTRLDGFRFQSSDIPAVKISDGTFRLWGVPNS